MTGFLRFLLERQGLEIITPPEQQGCQLSIFVHEKPQERHAALHEAGVVSDFRAPNVVRVAPVPLYNTFSEVWRFSEILAESSSGLQGRTD